MQHVTRPVGSEHTTNLKTNTSAEPSHPLETSEERYRHD